MGNHDEFDLDIRFMSGGGIWTSQAHFAQEPVIEGPTFQRTCADNCTAATCGTCQTCQTDCNQATCAATCGCPPPQLTTTLTASAGNPTFETSYSAIKGSWIPDPPQTVTLSLTFSGDRNSVWLNAPTQWSFVASAFGQSDTITITLSQDGTGSFTPASGSMSLPVSLTLTHTYPAWKAMGPSTANFNLTTGTATSPDGQLTDNGSPLNAQGQIKLVSGFQLSGGALSFASCLLKIPGIISPHP